MRNDAEETVNEETVQGLREMGAFGLQVTSEFSFNLRVYKDQMIMLYKFPTFNLIMEMK